MTRTQWGAALLALATGIAAPLSAQDAENSTIAPSPATATARTKADELFAEGRQLLEKGQYQEACARFKESHALDPAGGALLNLAACYERDGKTASAWRAYNEALAWANADRREDRSAYAVEHIRELEPLLARLVLDLPPRVRMNDIVVVVDGETLEAINGVRIPVDPGARVVEIQSPGREPYRTEVTAVAGEETRVEIPPLQQASSEGDSSEGPTSPSGEHRKGKLGETGPGTIEERPGACGCRVAAPSNDASAARGAFAALGALAGALILRRRRRAP